MRRLRSLFAAFCALALTGCAVATPFRGPGYDPDLGVTLEGNGSVVVAVTEAVLRNDRFKRTDFWTQVSSVEGTLIEMPGLIGYSKRTSLFGPQAWTVTVWKDEASLNAFVQSDVHQRAIAEAFDALKLARFVRFQAARTDVPVSWDRAIEMLEQQGRQYD